MTYIFLGCGLTIFINRKVYIFLFPHNLFHGILFYCLGHEKLLVMSLAIDDTLMRCVGVKVENLVALLAAETILVPPRLFSNKLLDNIGLLTTDFADFVDLNRRWFGNNLESKSI